MKPFGLIRCLMLPHAPNRRKVRRTDSHQYIGNCVHCGAPIKRIKRDKWGRDWARTFGLGGKSHAPDTPLDDEI
jgi:ribosomal protein L37E